MSGTNEFNRFRERLSEKAADARTRAVTYVAMGDSVTQGCMEAGVFEYDNVYHQVFKRAVERQYYGTVLNVVNSGVGGDTAHDSRPRWERDVLLYKPDLVTICFGHNDAHGGREGLDRFVAAVGELVGRIRAETEAEILIMTPCMMMKRDNERVAEEHRHFVPQFVKLAEEGILPLYVEALKRYASDNGVPCLDVYALWERLEAEGTDIHALLSNGINHPVADFHIRWGALLAERLLGGIENGSGSGGGR